MMWPSTTKIFMITLLTTLGSYGKLYADNPTVIGIVKDKITNEVIKGATVKFQEAKYSCITDSAGKFSTHIDKLKPLSVEISALGYKTETIEKLIFTISNETYLEIKLEQKENVLGEVRVEGSRFHTSIESPLSVKNLSSTEIERMPGGLRDVSRVLQALPGLAATPAWRNDLLVRGGGSYENKFYLDGIPIPSMNHFTARGASGGAYGIINPNYLKDINFYSGAFPMSKGNALSSIVDLKLKEGDIRKNNLGLVLSPTDLAITSDGPLTRQLTYLTSVRLSSWHRAAKTLGLLVSPEYYDYLLKLKYRPTQKSEVSFISIGTKDYAEPNLNAPNGLLINKKDGNLLSSMNTYLRQIATTKQNTYTVGLTAKHYLTNSAISVAVSRSYLDNSLMNYTNQRDKSEYNKNLDYSSREFQNTLSLNYSYQSSKGMDMEAGFTIDNMGINLSNFNAYSTARRIDTINYHTNFSMNQYGLFIQLNRSFEKFDLSFGVRTDFADYNQFVNKFYNQLSPKFSLSYKLNQKIRINFNSAIYNQSPLLTLLSYKSNQGQYVNLDSLHYMKCFHNVVGFDYLTDGNLKISVELYHKTYSNVPYLTNLGLVLPNTISFSQPYVGFSPANSRGFGRSYGLEVLLHQKLWNNYYGLVSYTLMKSEYSDGQGHYKPSNWDNRHTLSITGGKRFSRAWEIGAKLRVSSGSPYTPIDYDRSSIRAVFDLNPLGVLDVSRLNNSRLGLYHALDIRLEKKYVFRKLTVNVFLDIQNVYNTAPQMPPFLSQVFTSEGQALISLGDPAKYQVRESSFKAPVNILPTCGVAVNLK